MLFVWRPTEVVSVGVDNPVKQKQNNMKMSKKRGKNKENLALESVFCTESEFL